MGHVITWDGVFGASVGSARDVWLVTASTKSSHRTHRLFYWHWNGRRLTRLPEPDPPVGSAFDEHVTVADDGHGGAWFQPAEHWTGKRWRYPLRDYGCPGVPLWLDEAPVPHSWSAWATDFCQASGPKAGTFIDVNGPLP